MQSPLHPITRSVSRLSIGVNSLAWLVRADWTSELLQRQAASRNWPAKASPSRLD